MAKRTAAEIKTEIDEGKEALPALREAAKTAAEAHKAAKAAKDEDGATDAGKEREAAEQKVKDTNEHLKKLRYELSSAKEAEKEQRVRQNGVLQPKAGSKCGAVWEVLNEISAAKKAPATLGEAVERAEAINTEIEAGKREGAPFKIGNVRAEYANWRKFHGVPAQGRAPKDEPEPAKEETADAG